MRMLVEGAEPCPCTGIAGAEQPHGEAGRHVPHPGSTFAYPRSPAAPGSSQCQRWKTSWTSADHGRAPSRQPVPGLPERWLTTNAASDGSPLALQSIETSSSTWRNSLRSSTFSMPMALPSSV